MINLLGTPAGFVSGEDGVPSFAMPAQAGEMVEFDPSSEAPGVEEVVPEGPPGSVLEVKYLHEIHDMFKNQWTIRPAPPSTEDGQAGGKNDAQKYNVYAFSVIRKFNHSQDGKANTFNVTTLLQINSPELIKVGQDVIGHVQGISWTAKPLRVRYGSSSQRER